MAGGGLLFRCSFLTLIFLFPYCQFLIPLPLSLSLRTTSGLWEKTYGMVGNIGCFFFLLASNLFALGEFTVLIIIVVIIIAVVVTLLNKKSNNTTA